MGFGKLVNRSDPGDEALEIARRYFEPQLERLGLAASQIDDQPLEQLRRSLLDINDAIANPANFGVLRLKYTPTSAVVVSGQGSAHIEVGILPILLERRTLINERIRALELGNEVAGIREQLAEVGTDASARTELERQLEETRAAEHAAANAARAATEAQSRADLELRLEIQAKRAQIYQSWLRREPIAGLVGGLLLVLLAVVVVIAMFTGITVTDIVSSAFLLILGYFFGQASGRTSPPA